MANKWVEHVRAFAKKKGISYGCAVSDEQCKSSYHAGKDVPALETPMRTSRVIKATPPKGEAAKPPSSPAAPAKTRMKRVKDIVRKRFDDHVYYSNRFADKLEAYVIVNGKVMIIGRIIEDYGGFELFDEPTSIPKNIRFYDDDNKPIKRLNDLQ